jgi:hypothetical protein
LMPAGGEAVGARFMADLVFDAPGCVPSPPA